MNKTYKSALGKIKLNETEKEKAKALFHESNIEKKRTLKPKKSLKPIMAIAACLIVVLTTNAVISTVQNNHASHTKAENSFTITAYAKELTQTKKVYSDKYEAASSAICGTEDGDISFAFEFPVTCKGENIDTITYQINEGAFTISNPEGKSIVVAGEKLKKALDVPEQSISSDGNVTFTSEIRADADNISSVAGETKIEGLDASDTTTESEKAETTETLPIKSAQYKSFTVSYDNQTNDKTYINVVDTSDIWTKEKKMQYKALEYDICNSSIEEKKEVCDFLTKNLGITCTVTYKDGSTETKDIVISNDIVELSDVVEGELCKGKEHTKMVAKCFSIK